MAAQSIDERAQLLDLNGDGLTDRVTGVGGTWRVCINTGNGFITDAANKCVDTGIASTNYQYAQLVDYNLDGRADVLVPHSATGDQYWYVLLSTGNGLAPPVNTGISSAGYDHFARLIDINGDGLPDLFFTDNVTSGTWKVAVHAGVKPDLLQTVTNGLGAMTTITYKPLTDATVYTKGTGAVVPQQDFQGPLYVVSQYSTSDGVGGSYPITYNYQGARINVQGHGFSGFSQITATDTRTGIITQTTYADTTYANWPLFGLVTAVTKSYNGATINSQVNTLSYYWYGTAYATYYFPYVSKTIVTNYELPPTGSSYVVSTVTTNNTYHGSCATSDAYCDLTSIAVTTTAGADTLPKPQTTPTTMPVCPIGFSGV